MSGEGLLAARPAEGERMLSDEMADVIAFLEQRRDNALTMSRNSAEFAASAKDRARQIGVMIDDFRAGMHQGAADVRARLLARQGSIA